MSYDNVDSFHIRFTEKKLFCLEDSIKIICQIKRIVGSYDVSTLIPREVEALPK
jgi:hypothetical protein